MILFCYDGSQDARDAAERVPELFPGASVTVLTVWAPVIDIARDDELRFAAALDDHDANEQIAARASATADEGAAAVSEAGVDARARAEQRRGSVATTILEVAAELDAAAIVLGTRGMGAFKTMVLGSAAHAVVGHADRPVVVIPSKAVATARREHRG